MLNKSIRSHLSANDFFQQIQHLLIKREAEHSLFYGLLEAAKKSQIKSKITMLDCRSDGQVIAAAMVAGLHLIVTAGSASFAREIAEFLFKNDIHLPGVIGPDLDAMEFAKIWSELNNCKMKLAMNQRIYELRQVQWPKGILGKARLVTEKDVPLLASWLEGFYLDAIPWELPSKEKILQGAEARVPQAMTFFWEVDSHPVCMAALSRPTEKGITINAVYTPQQYRRKGYATALVAAVSSEGLNRGKEFCVLYTDLSNPTSNSIYQKIGYEPVGDSKNYIFEK